jgi:hypothetical protein
MSSTLASQIISLLTENISPALIASTLGCDPSYISQISAAHAEEIRAARLSKQTAAISRDNKLDAVEDRLISRLDETIPYLHKPGEIARVLQIVNSAKRRTAPADLSASSLQGAPIVTIVLPSGAQNPLIINQANNQVVQIGQTPLIPLQVAALERMTQDVQNSAISSERASQATNLLSNSQEDIG